MDEKIPPLGGSSAYDSGPRRPCRCCLQRHGNHCREGRRCQAFVLDEPPACGYYFVRTLKSPNSGCCGGRLNSHQGPPGPFLLSIGPGAQASAPSISICASGRWRTRRRGGSPPGSMRCGSPGGRLDGMTSSSMTRRLRKLAAHASLRHLQKSSRCCVPTGRDA